MEFFLFLLYNQENSRQKYFPAKRGEINMKGTSCEYCAKFIHMMKSVTNITVMSIWMRMNIIVL